jgi:hypothetical protein
MSIGFDARRNAPLTGVGLLRRPLESLHFCGRGIHVRSAAAALTSG